MATTTEETRKKLEKNPEFKAAYRQLEVGDIAPIAGSQYKVKKILNRGRLVLKRINAN